MLKPGYKENPGYSECRFNAYSGPMHTMTSHSDHKII